MSSTPAIDSVLHKYRQKPSSTTKSRNHLPIHEKNTIHSTGELNALDSWLGNLIPKMESIRYKRKECQKIESSIVDTKPQIDTRLVLREIGVQASLIDIHSEKTFKETSNKLENTIKQLNNYKKDLKKLEMDKYKCEHDLNEKCNSHIHEIADLNAIILQKENEIKLSNNDIKLSNEKMNKIEISKIDFEQELKQLKKELNQLKNENAKLQEGLLLSRHEKSLKEQEIDFLHRQIQTLETNDKIYIEIERQEREKILKHDNTIIDELKKRLLDQQQHYLSEISKIEQRAKDQINAAIQNEKQQFKKAIMPLEDAYKNGVRDIIDMKILVREALQREKKAINSMNCLKENNITFQKKISDQESDIEILSEKIHENERKFTIEIQNLRTTMSEQNDMIQALKIEKSQANDAKSSIESKLEAERKSKLENIYNLDNQISALKNALSVKERMLDDQNDSLAKLKVKISESHFRDEEMISELERLREDKRKFDESQNELITLRSHLVRAEEKAEERARLLTYIENDINALRNEHHSTESQYKNKLIDIQRENERINLLLTQNESDITSFKQEKVILSERISTISKQLSDTKSIEKELSFRNKELIQEISNLNNSLSSSKQEQRELMREIYSMKQQHQAALNLAKSLIATRQNV